MTYAAQHPPHRRRPKERLALMRSARTLRMAGVKLMEIARILGISQGYASLVSRSDESDERCIKGVISDISREIGVSPQRAWAIANEAAGRCRLCGGELEGGRKSRCERCMRKELAGRRRRNADADRH